MGRKDDEIKRIIKYANGLGIRIEYKKHKHGDPGASWDLKGDLITIWEWPRKSKIRTILDLVHELAHHMAWVHSGRKLDKATTDAWDKEAEDHTSLTKEERYLIYLSEANDAQYRGRIVKELGLKIPEWLQKVDRALDVWYYKEYYINGEYPTVKEIDDKKKELKKEIKK